MIKKVLIKLIKVKNASRVNVLQLECCTIIQMMPFNDNIIVYYD